jgi:hypothetical protein
LVSSMGRPRRLVPFSSSSLAWWRFIDCNHVCNPPLKLQLVGLVVFGFWHCMDHYLVKSRNVCFWSHRLVSARLFLPQTLPKPVSPLMMLCELLSLAHRCNKLRQFLLVSCHIPSQYYKFSGLWWCGEVRFIILGSWTAVHEIKIGILTGCWLTQHESRCIALLECLSNPDLFSGSVSDSCMCCVSLTI